MTPLEEAEHAIKVAREIKDACELIASEGVVEVDFSSLPALIMRERSDAVKKLVVYAEQLEAQIADLKIDVQMHEREHQRVERARELVKRWRGPSMSYERLGPGDCADELEAELQ